MSFQQGVSGLNAASRNLSVIGNNVANASTVGAKSARAEFADVYARAATSGVNIGLGVSVAAVTQQFSQGSISSTNNALDVAINGNGFFQLKDPNGNLQYSRNGQFQVDRTGYITNAQGLQLLGHPIVPQGGQVPGQAQPLQLPTAGIKPSATTSVKLEINLDARNEASFDAAAPTMVDFNTDTTYNSTTSLTVYDAKGQAVSLTYFFQKTDADTWNLYASANGEVINPDGGGNAQPLTTLTFQADGGAPIAPVGPLILDVPVTGAGTALASQPIVGIELDLSKLTQYGSVFGPTDVSQNGFPPGRLTSVAVQGDGTLIASYSSGQSAPIARVELANFRNPQGLQPLGGNAWASTWESGDAVLGVPGGGNLGLLESKSLEDSNVDLTNELVSMMVAQRIYQANAQTIKTEDGVMQTLVNLR